jgi:hypothetical protein
MTDMETNQKAARAARRFLTDRVRNDWEWPEVPDCWSASDEEVRGVLEFRERYYGTSASEETETEAEASAAASPYKFDSPDSIGDAVEQKRQNRKRKRRAAQNKEMEWNDGLRMFVQRRDAWTGAASVKKYGMKASEQETRTAGTDSASSDTLVPPPPEVSSEKNDPADPLIPLAPRLLADNPIRASIRPEAYGEIFNNIVVTNRTPSVPVNLADMTRALVYGWKELGEWPPKAGPLDPLAGRKRAAPAGPKPENGHDPFLAHHPHMKRGVDSVKRILHFNGHAQDHTSTEKNG